MGWRDRINVAGQAECRDHGRIANEALERIAERLKSAGEGKFDDLISLIAKVLDDSGNGHGHP